jgi:hypothetical protein
MDYVLFSLIEAIIFNLFFINIGKLNRIKWWQVPIMAFINCALSCTLPPLVYQPIVIISNAIFLLLNKNSIKNSFKYSALSVLFFLIMETAYNVVLEVFFHFDAIGVNRDEKLKIFLIIIPLRIIEVITLFLYRKIKGNK